MTETSSTLRWNDIRQTVREPLKVLAEHLQAGLGDNLRSITVVGSGLTEDYQPGSSDINTVVVVDRLNAATLNAVASVAKRTSRQRLSPPLLMTPAYIDRSRDVFGVEFLDLQLTHETILGDDPFAAIRVDKPDVRLQCERELKAMLIRMRQGYVAAAGDRVLVRDILISTAKGLAPLARAMLWLKDVERPKTMEPALRRAATEFKVDLETVIVAERWRYEQPRLTDAQVENAFAALADAVDALTTTIDEMKL
jgi:hypothetical protein